MNKPSVNFLSSKLLQIFFILVASTLAAVGVVYLAPIFINILNSARKGKISSAIIIFSLVFFVISFVIGLSRKHWKILTPSYPLIGFMMVSLVVNSFALVTLNDYRWLSISIGLPLIYLSLTGLIKRYKMAIALLLVAVFISLIVVILLTFTDSTGSFPSMRGILQSRYRVYLLNNQYGPITLATLASTLFVLATGMLILIQELPKLIRFFLFTTALFSIIGLIASGGRVAWISTLLSLFAIGIGARKLEIWSARRFLTISLIGVFVTIFLQIWNNQQVMQRLYTLPDVLLNLSRDGSMRTRIYLWQEAITLATSNPIGIGFSTFNQEFGLSTHNEFLNILLGVGFTGFVLFYGFYFLNIALVVKALRTKTKSKNKNLLIILLTLLFHVLIISMTESWSISNTIASLLFWIVFAESSLFAHFQIKHDKNCRIKKEIL